MTEEEALAKINEAILSAVDDAEPVSIEQDLKEDDVLDSLDMISFLFELEESTGLKFPEGDLDDHGLYKISNLINYICEKAK